MFASTSWATATPARQEVARVVGDVIGKYHPHGDSAVYDALVRMAQDFSMRDPWWTGRATSAPSTATPRRPCDTPKCACPAWRANSLPTSTRNGDFRPNYDNTLLETYGAATKVPNLLLNGSSGIAVGMATNIPPHNLGELCDGLLHCSTRPPAGPDIIGLVRAGLAHRRGHLRRQGPHEAYTTGRAHQNPGPGEVEERRKTMFRGHPGNPVCPQQVFLVERSRRFINDGRIEGVSDLARRVHRKGIRMSLISKRASFPDIVINALYKYTPLETSLASTCWSWRQPARRTLF